MGNKLGRQVVDEKYTRPQGLYHIKDVDYKRLRKLILESKLAPCYPGDDDSDSTLLEECPICFLHYPTLNRSRCCTKSICTECFLQMKNPDLATPTLCPFCKMSNYAVEYKGVKSKEERGQEEIEEQKVIEAKIRMRQQELRDDEEKKHKNEEVSSSGIISDTGNNVRSASGSIEQREEIIQDASTTHRQSQSTRQNRDNDFDLDLEDLMVMEAIWLSIQEKGIPEQYSTRDHYIPPVTEPSPAPEPSSPSGGFACAIAALAERQQLSGESSTSSSPFDMLPSSSRNSQRLKNSSRYPPENYSSSRVMGNARMFTGDHEVDHVSDISVVGTSYINSDDSDDDAVVHPPPPPPQYGRPNNHKKFDNIRRKYTKISKNLHDTLAKERGFNLRPPLIAGTSGVHSDDVEADDEYHVPSPAPALQYGSDGSFQSSMSSPVIPESFEEQMMLAMAVSLAEAQNTTNAPGVSWQ